METTKVKENGESPIIQQLEQFFSNLRSAESEGFSKRQSEEGYEVARAEAAKLLRVLNARADEVSSSEYGDIVEAAKSLLNSAVYHVICIDGRVNRVRMNGLGVHMSGAIKTPGGKSPDFYATRDPSQLTLDPQSATARMLFHALKNGDTTEVLDSHLSCAAQQRDEALAGHPIDDGGLREDVLLKKKMAAAIQRFAETSSSMHGGSDMQTIQTSFDPHSGFLYMGLETDDALHSSENGIDVNGVHKSGYSPEMIDGLVESGQIISTLDIVLREPDIAIAFKEQAFKLEWEKEYMHTAGKFWDAIGRLKIRVFDYFLERVQQIYPTDPPKLQEDCAMLLLTNAFSGYLDNKMYDSVLNEDEIRAIKEGKRNDYSKHKESVVAVSEGLPVPFDGIMNFNVSSVISTELPDHISLAQSIVRTVRGNMKDEEIANSGFNSRSEFVKAPVPSLVMEFVDTDEMDESVWEGIANANWRAIEKVWILGTDDDFKKAIESLVPVLESLTFGAVQAFLNSMIRLRANMTSIHLGKTRTQIEKHEVIAVPVLCDRSRRPRLVFNWLPQYKDS